MPKCLLFDCDGTLVDSERLGNIALATKFKTLGITLDADELTSRFSGWKMANILDNLSNEYEITLADNFTSSYRELVAQLFEADLKPIDGIITALDQLKQSKAVVSSGPMSKIELSVRVCGLTKYFGHNMYSAYDIEIWKPDPGLFLHAAKDMGFSTDQCIVIEDSAVGIEAGLNAGMITLFFNPDNEENFNPQAISFQSMEEIADLINEEIC
ncbi:MAG: HAD-IA family hydrolase [Gammaproteobacteria bacterium]|jgi:HAD superfamily hydrolase (TIGR01509 family)|nr:HAD-IA family hydrolase [Gammaproteobacteria bacterium]MBT3725538.1 HAD-IA family hydrolase [Gammaproteobacteria bacterium]MBT4075110.1 HAD-IA family hydrolase [Gammaproteobacteria bacterium]MBT4194580.1 HAD-IA family hydrolase [Gammaproteobacteria bacterium]MBT4448854.1 HAD-IA family hydrolase [Gammaproteobacteria bacterium]